MNDTSGFGFEVGAAKSDPLEFGVQRMLINNDRDVRCPGDAELQATADRVRYHARTPFATIVGASRRSSVCAVCSKSLAVDSGFVVFGFQKSRKPWILAGLRPRTRRTIRTTTQPMKTPLSVIARVL